MMREYVEEPARIIVDRFVRFTAQGDGALAAAALAAFYDRIARQFFEIAGPDIAREMMAALRAEIDRQLQAKRLSRLN